MKLAVITDTSAYLSPSDLLSPHLFRLDIPIVFGKETFVEGKTFTLDDFYARMAESDDLPKTSQPSLADLVAILDHLVLEEYTHVIGLFLSSGISGFWQNIQYLIEDYPSLTLSFPDTKITSAPLGDMVSQALKDANQGLTFEMILARLDEKILRTAAYIMVDDLDHLVKGGRLSNGAALIGNLLSIKPILYFNNGSIEVFDKVRTEKKAIKRLLTILDEGTKNGQGVYDVYIIHAKAKDKAQAIYDLLDDKGYHKEHLHIVPFNSVIATHLGQGAVALAFSPFLPITNEDN